MANRLVYLDSGASAQKPEAVIEAMSHAMRHSYANVHRGLHRLANETTDAYEAGRETVARFIGANLNEIVFTKSATEAVNLVAWSWGERLQAGDEILTTEMEHHANIVPLVHAVPTQGLRAALYPHPRRWLAGYGGVRRHAVAQGQDRRRHSDVKRAGHAQ